MTNFIYIPELPASIHGFVIEDCNGDYTVVLNPSMSYDMQIKTAKHETEHIENDFHQDLDVDMIEAERHK